MREEGWIHAQECMGGYESTYMACRLSMMRLREGRAIQITGVEDESAQSTRTGTSILNR